jgi:hypothetical protein
VPRTRPIVPPGHSPSIAINRGQLTTRRALLLTSKNASGNVSFPIFLRYSRPPEHNMSEQVKKTVVGERPENLRMNMDLPQSRGQLSNSDIEKYLA